MSTIEIIVQNSRDVIEVSITPPIRTSQLNNDAGFINQQTAIINAIIFG